MKYLALDKGTVAYVEHGTGEPMLFLHNGGSGHWVWKYQIEHFSQNYRVFAFDLLGCGSSDRPDETYNVNFYADSINEIISKLDLIQVIIIGNCVGATAALEYTISNPANVKALVLCNVCGGPRMMSPSVRLASVAFPRKLKTVQKFLLYMFARIPKLITFAVRRNYAKKPDHKNPVYIAEEREAHNPAQTKSRLNLIQGLSSYNTYSGSFYRPSELPPILVFWGQKNRVLPIKKGIEFCNRLRPFKTEFISNAGHLLMAEKPKEVNIKIDMFIKSLS